MAERKVNPGALSTRAVRALLGHAGRFDHQIVHATVADVDDAVRYEIVGVENHPEGALLRLREVDRG